MSVTRPAFGFIGTPGDPLPLVQPEDVGFSSERLQRIRTVLEADIAGGKMPGGVLAIARRGKLAALETYGFRDKAGGIAMTADSLFNIASMTKAVTSVAALQLRGAADRDRLHAQVAQRVQVLADVTLEGEDADGGHRTILRSLSSW